MSQPTSFIDCRGLSAPLTVLRIKQAVVGRRDCGLPLDVLVDGACCEPDRISASLTGESTDVRLLYSADTSGVAVPKAQAGAAAEIRHV
ncbi:hypothetical protein RGUI_4284 (plasmid) [Rhodovulum sp. P5]|uniref:hypothetical protein n=1 Tax=Rhodovulum sp. P5 TaxID=1564506 RepID=UPI0009C37F1C|nr:hypothetical protein [Rhodovulum sp. P5]ARE42310.1 hypothetical protein RGUI_4284 [Rhodovulum sp. P5]